MVSEVAFVGLVVISVVATVASVVIAVARGGSILSHPESVAVMASTMKPAAILIFFIGSPPIESN
jgi:hypothetical protein